MTWIFWYIIIVSSLYIFLLNLHDVRDDHVHLRFVHLHARHLEERREHIRQLVRLNEIGIILKQSFYSLNLMQFLHLFHFPSCI